MSEQFVDFDPPNRVAGPIRSPDEAFHVRIRLGAILILGGREFLRVRQVLRDDLERLIAWEEDLQ